MLRVVANDVDHASTADEFTFDTHGFDTGPNFHSYFVLYVILPFVASYGVISSLTLSPGMIRIK